MIRSKILYIFFIMTAIALIAVTFHFMPLMINPSHSITQAHFKILWSHPTKKQILGSPILAGDLIVFGTYDGTLEAISRSNGGTVWSIKLSDSIFSLTEGKDNTIYVGTGLHESKTGVLYAINFLSGNILWQREFVGHLEEPPALDLNNHRLWVGAGPGSLWAIDTKDGATLWHKDLGHLDATPLLHQGVLYVPAQKEESLHESFFYAMEADDGQIRWKLDQPGQPWATPLLDKTGAMIFTTTADGQIGLHRSTDKGWAQAISIDGRNVWQTILPDMALTPNIYIPQSDIVIYVTKIGKIIALNSKDGTTAWEIQVAGGFSSPGSLVTAYKEKLVATTSEDGLFTLIDARTGQIMFTRKMEGSASSAPLSDNKALYITTNFSITALGEM